MSFTLNSIGTPQISLASTLTTSGANPLTFTTTGTTNVTLPTTGTLVNDAVTTLSSLVSIGTITTGVWHGTVIDPTYGGTGVNNGGNTLTLAAPLTTSGAFATTLTVTGVTNITLPTGGTLCTTVGSTSIVTVGTITTGTWNGSVITGTYGGTGVNNGASTITIGGNVAFSGAFTTTLTVTGATSVTLPTTGTLVNTAVTTLSSLASVGTVTTGTWSAGLKDYTETVQSDNSTATYTINMGNGNWFKITLTANCTFSMSNVPATAGQGVSLTLVLKQDATGSRTVTWPASFDWGTAGAPTLTTTANKVDMVTAISDDNGTTWRALLAGKGFGA